MMQRAIKQTALWCVSGLAVLAGANHVAANDAPQKNAACAQWVAKKGYAHDYIAHRLGIRPPEPGQWVNNIQRDEMDAGDVVTIKRWPGHVAVIDTIERDSAGTPKRVKVSDFNALGQWQDRGCAITSNFGKEQSRWLPVGEIDGQWRPPRPRSY